MAKIYPFRPYRYTEQAGRLEDLVTQPYDKISPAMQARCLKLNPYNLVRVILGERFPGDSAADNVYTRSAACLKDWIARGILAREPGESLYAYFQEFTLPDSNERLVRKGFIGLGAVEDYSAGVVHRHEQTLSGPKKDRMELLRHTLAHPEQLFMLYADPQGEIDRLLDEAARSEPIADVCDEYQAIHRVFKISDPETILEIRKRMGTKKLLIADGHHRYETALAFRNENPGLADAARVQMTFVNMHSPGLRILPGHRLVAGLAGFERESFLQKAAAGFRIERVDSVDTMKKLWAEPHQDKIRIGAGFAGSGDLFLLEAKRQFGQLDVKVLHESVLEALLGITPEAVKEEKYIRYVRGLDAALDVVRAGEAQAAFLLEPPSIEEVARISFSGGVMPQKSTDFYPKLLSGLTIYKLEG
jgi:uncharacterized protein (DUF1015 family)